MRLPYFWVRCLQVPVSVMALLQGVVENAFGSIMQTYSPYKVRGALELQDIRFELIPSAKTRFQETLIVDLEEDGVVEVELVCANTPWCESCRCFYHWSSDESCPSKPRTKDQQNDPAQNEPKEDEVREKEGKADPPDGSNGKETTKTKEREEEKDEGEKEGGKEKVEEKRHGRGKGKNGKGKKRGKQRKVVGLLKKKWVSKGVKAGERKESMEEEKDNQNEGRKAEKDLSKDDEDTAIKMDEVSSEASDSEGSTKEEEDRSGTDGGKDLQSRENEGKGEREEGEEKDSEGKILEEKGDSEMVVEESKGEGKS
ncbi:hypothetical protein CBR_g74754, partial [Chara braunii]